MLRDALELYFEDVPAPTMAKRAKNPVIASVTLSCV